MTLPAGPRRPSALQLLEWVRRPFALMDECAARFGDAFTLRFAGIGTLVFFSSPDDLRAIFTGDADVLHAGEANALLSGVLGPSSVLTLDGAEHLRQRKLLLPPFQGERMQAYAAAMRDATLRSIAAWPAGEPFALQPLMQAITLDVIVRTVFGVTEGAAKSRLVAALERLLRTIGAPYALLIPPTLSIFGERAAAWAQRRITAEVDRELYAEIAARRAAADGAGRDDILSLLLEHPDALARVEAEVAEGGHDQLDAAIKESMRLRPIVPIVVRTTKAPVMIGGREIPAGVKVAPCIYLAQRRPELYPEPHLFRPERFLGGKPDPYRWLPFGGGIRRCIGIHFALLEMRIVIATVLERTRLRLASSEPVRFSRRGITIAPADGTRVVLSAAAPSARSRSSSPART
ncbi:MAG TPA: cytochrome P450 [Planctomycetota bacterium]|nr:cytochrome P450 [Planctomycetota bacterium]